MKESGYYPSGAEHDPSAPYNQHDPEEVEVKLMVSQTLSKNGITCYTDDYIPGEHGVDWDTDYDDEGNYITVPSEYQEPNDFSNTDWEQVADSNNVLTPLDIISLYKELIECIMSGKSLPDKYKRDTWLDYVMDQCNSWTVDDQTIMQDELC